MLRRMKNFRLMGSCLVFAVFALSAGAGCSSDSSGGGKTATGGSGGTGATGGGGGGTGGAGGAAGGGGAAGSGGSTGGAAGAGGSTGGAAGSGGAAGTGGAAAATCAGYCDTLMKDCTGADAQYSSKDACSKGCDAYPKGSPGEKAGNSLECRAYHVGNVAAGGVAHCGHAGPAGDGVCGSNCDGYCNLMMKYCTSAYTDLADCTTKCKTISGATASGYDIGTQSGDNLFCRIYHATAAAADTTQPSSHCGHAQLDPTAICL